MSASQLALFPAAEVFDAAGLALCESLDAEFRRAQGITLTPGWLVDLMLQRLAAAGPFRTIVDRAPEAVASASRQQNGSLAPESWPWSAAKPCWRCCAVI